ncbi:MAG: hypothetical protein WCF16_03995 [Alphaproteobacteria bacterium]
MTWAGTWAETWKAVRLSEVLFLIAMALLIVIGKALFHRHLHVPGHTSLFVVFFVLMAKGGVPRAGSGALVGLFAGSQWLLTGLAAEGPLSILTFIIPAAVIDGLCVLLPSAPRKFLPAALVGAVAGFSRVVGLIPGEMAAAADPWIVIHSLAIKSLAGLAFGIAGAVLVPTLVRRLDRSGILPR